MEHLIRMFVEGRSKKYYPDSSTPYPHRGRRSHAAVLRSGIDGIPLRPVHGYRAVLEISAWILLEAPDGDIRNSTGTNAADAAANLPAQ